MENPNGLPVVEVSTNSPYYFPIIPNRHEIMAGIPLQGWIRRCRVWLPSHCGTTIDKMLVYGEMELVENYDRDSIHLNPTDQSIRSPSPIQWDGRCSGELDPGLLALTKSQQAEERRKQKRSETLAKIIIQLEEGMIDFTCALRQVQLLDERSILSHHTTHVTAQLRQVAAGADPLSLDPLSLDTLSQAIAILQNASGCP